MHVLDNGICVTCRPHVLVDGECVTCRTTASRNFNPTEPRDPHNGKWIDGPGSALGKAIGNMAQDAFFAAHGEDWEDQYGSRDTLQAIHWSNGEASLYRDLPNGKVQVFADINGHQARQLADGIHWAAHRPESGTPAKVTEQHAVDLGGHSAHIGYGHDGNGDLFVQAVMPGDTTIDMVDLDQAESLATDLGALADALDGKA